MNETNRHSEATLERFKLEQMRKESGSDTNEEYAAELTAPLTVPAQEQRERVEAVSVQEEGRASASRYAWIGYTALLFAILSLFIFPRMLGFSAVALGIAAYFCGRRAVGIWSVVIGLISLAGYFLLVPRYA